jgi:hypothetical protein
MYKPSTYLVVTYFPTYLRKYETYFFTELVTKMKSDITIVEVHPQLSNKGHPVDGVLVGAGSLGPPIFWFFEEGTKLGPEMSQTDIEWLTIPSGWLFF